jgi:quinol monooxygenase YgiN
MMIMTIRVPIAYQKYGEILKIIRSIAEQTRTRTGCICSHIYKDIQEKSVILIQEKWQDETALKEHLCSESFRTVLLLLETAYETPEICFSTVTGATGIEIIEKAKSGLKQGRFPQDRIP